MKHAGGRPSKYDPKFCDMVDAYLATAVKENMHLPKLQSFAIYLNVSMDALEDWRKKYPEFSGALEKIMRYQAERLIDDGMYGGKEVNATIVKLLLQNNHGMREKSDLTTDGDKIGDTFYILDGHEEIEEITEGSDAAATKATNST